MNKPIKNYAFIDSQNLNLGVRALGWKLDFKRFRVYLKDKCNVDKAFLFIGYIPQYQTLYTQLQKDGYVCVFKPTLKLACDLSHLSGYLESHFSPAYPWIECNNFQIKKGGGQIR